jgi:hypothetical protein
VGMCSASRIATWPNGQRYPVIMTNRQIYGITYVIGGLDRVRGRAYSAAMPKR